MCLCVNVNVIVIVIVCCVRVCVSLRTPTNRLQSGLCTIPRGIKSVSASACDPLKPAPVMRPLIQGPSAPEWPCLPELLEHEVLQVHVWVLGTSGASHPFGCSTKEVPGDHGLQSPRCPASVRCVPCPPRRTHLQRLRGARLAVVALHELHALQDVERVARLLRLPHNGRPGSQAH